jgi:hypothetical protein
MLNRRSLLRAGGGLAVAATATAISSTPVFGAGPDWQKLRSLLQGDVVLPADANYDQAKQVHLAEFDSVRPQGIAYCETPADVRTAILFAQDNSLPVRTRSGGHNFAGWSTGEGLVLDVSRLNQVSVTGSTVHLGPGAQSVDAVTALKAYGKQVVAGTCPTVCPGGFISGGGIGFQTRKFGTGSDRLVSAQIVLADGRTIRTSATCEPELYWALRGGGGGNFGIVTDFEVRPIQAPQMVIYNTTWAWDDAPAVIAAWLAWTANGSNNLGGQLLIVLPDAAPGATPIVLLRGGYLGPKTELDTALDQLVSLTGKQPTSRFSSDLPYDEAMKWVYGCDQITVPQCHRVGENPAATLARGGWMRERTRLFRNALPSSTISDLLAAYGSGRRAGQAHYLAFTALGGAANQPARSATAYVHRDIQYLVGFAAAIDSTPTPAAEDAANAEAWTTRGFDVFNPVSSGNSYINFPDMRLDNWQWSYYAENYPRLQQAKRTYDRDNFFRHPRSIAP